MKKFKILLADGLPYNEYDLEARVLQIFLENSGKAKVEWLEIGQDGSAKDFKNKLIKEYLNRHYDIVHICSHGTRKALRFGPKGRKEALLNHEELKNYKFRCKLFFSTACGTGEPNARGTNYFWEALRNKCSFFVGPARSIEADNAIMLSILFYDQLFYWSNTKTLRKDSIEVALKRAKNSMRLDWGRGHGSGAFEIWPKNK